MRGDTDGIAEEIEDTRSFQAVEPAQPPEPGPPPGLIDDVWPWLGLLALLALAALLVWLFVLRGHGHHQARAAPRVVGLQERVAIRRLTNAGYSVKSIREPLKRPRGVVGAQQRSGSTVVIHVSNGRTPPARSATTTTQTTTARTTTVAAPTAAVPDVTGQVAAAGAGQVEAAGFVAETDPVQAGGPAGAIVQENPAGGTQAKAGQTVTLGVATGSQRPSVQIPNVVGQPAAAARAALLQAKLTVRTTYAKGTVGVVLDESPTGSAAAWTQVTLSVGR